MVINSFSATVVCKTPGAYIIKRTADNSVLEVPALNLEHNRRVPTPPQLLDSTGRIADGTTLFLVKMSFDGSVRYYLDEKVYNNSPLRLSPEERQLKEDMLQGESQEVEFKSSLWHPADPNNADDHTFQRREIIKTLAAAANSGSHHLRLYVGVSRNKEGKYEVSGIDQELKEHFEDSADALSTGFLNLVTQLLGKAFLMSIDLKMLDYHGKRVLLIRIEHKGDVVLYSKQRSLFIRNNASVHELEGQGYIEAIRYFTNNKNL